MGYPTSKTDLNDEQVSQLAARGLTVEDVQQQLDTLNQPQAVNKLNRPCTIGDGIRTLPSAEREPLVAIHEEVVQSGRLSEFILASEGNDSLFAALLDTPDSTSADGTQIQEPSAKPRRIIATRRFLDALPRFPFYAALDKALDDNLEALRAQGDVSAILDKLLSPEGLNYAQLPTGLTPVHSYESEIRTPFAEHLIEAAQLVRDSEGTCRAHFVVDETHRDKYESVFQELAPDLETRLGCRYDVEFSSRASHTDSIAVGEDGHPALDQHGALQFRPAGHGALLENLQACNADMVLIRKIDSIARDRVKSATYLWAQLLTGLAARTHDRARHTVRQLRRNPQDRLLIDRALRFFTQGFGCPIPASLQNGDSAVELSNQLIDYLDRPLRVCGVVPHSDESSSGPFWQAGQDGSFRPQFVEAAQIDLSSRHQRACLERSTHVNPVFMVCSLRDSEGEPYALDRFTDTSASTIEIRCLDGKPAKSVHRPGLWNGAMAGWNTILVEISAAAFSPIRSVNDLLRSEHQPDESSAV